MDLRFSREWTESWLANRRIAMKSIEATSSPFSMHEPELTWMISQFWKNYLSGMKAHSVQFRSYFMAYFNQPFSGRAFKISLFHHYPPESCSPIIKNERSLRMWNTFRLFQNRNPLRRHGYSIIQPLEWLFCEGFPDWHRHNKYESEVLI